MLPPFSLSLPQAEEIVLLKCLGSRWGFLSAARKEPKTTKGGAFPRLVESTPRYWVEGAPFSFWPWTGLCHIDGDVILQSMPTSLKAGTSTPRALPW